MLFSVNTNNNSLLAQKALVRTNVGLNKSVKKLSRALNSSYAGEDAAGLDVSKNLESGFYRSTGRNNGIAATAMLGGSTNSALQTVSNTLMRMRDLATQAGSENLATGNPTPWTPLTRDVASPKGNSSTDYTVVDGQIATGQIADGAMGEVGGLLTRMNELAMQSANGTYSDTDRTALLERVDATASSSNDSTDSGPVKIPVSENTDSKIQTKGSRKNEFTSSGNSRVQAIATAAPPPLPRPEEDQSTWPLLTTAQARGTLMSARASLAKDPEASLQAQANQLPDRALALLS